MDGEEWRDIPGFENEYQASSLGRIRSKCRPGTVRSEITYGGKVLVQNTSGGPRALVTLSKDNVVTTHQVSVLVCKAFYGPCPPDKDLCAHWDGDGWNNAASNLRWATYIENEDDKRRHDRHAVGERNPAVKLTQEIVEEIRRDHKGHYGESARLARKFGVSTTQICDIVHGKCWSDEGNEKRRIRRRLKKVLGPQKRIY